MLGRIESSLRRLRRRLSRSVWLARLLKLPASEGAPSRPGLVIIQIDGLSHAQLKVALRRGEMPFLRRLLRREHYRLHVHYSGLPATTPAVQAELFYGVKAAVPAFSFRDHESGQLIRMYEPDAAGRVEALQETDGQAALLEGGSAYADALTGGAAESHFCPSAIGWGPALRAANPLVVLAFLLSNLYSFARVAVLLVVELGLALVDFVRGLVRGHDVIKEMKFVPTRVAISILLRELCVIGGKIDVGRGLPIVHLNFIGYDEQSHRRGPRSLFAHWTLKGIDDAVARLWRAAHRSAWRHYEVWVYSDHGQDEVRAFEQVQGYDLEAAAAAACRESASAEPGLGREEGIQTQRVRILGGERIQRLFAVLGINDEIADERQPVVAGLGPVGHIYLPSHLKGRGRERVAAELVRRHGVPLVLSVEASGRLRAFTADAEFRLPQDAAELFGAQHPFLEPLTEDLPRLCRHPDAGDLVVLGWRDGVGPLTFARENGAHGGLSPEETRGFALIPQDAPLGEGGRGYLRPSDLRRAALRYLGRRRPAPQRRAVKPAAGALRVMTYNVHACVGLDGKLDVERIARVIARCRPDVVALQELDVGRMRSQGMDQAQLIAHQLEMEFHFHPAMHLEEERYGDAILTRLPQRLVKAGALPGLADRPRLEPRGALWVAVEHLDREIQVINTHLGLLPRERLAQVEALLGADWLGSEDCRAPVVLCGDLNARPSSAVCRRLAGRLRDAQSAAPGHRARGTFPSRFAILRIDHLFVSPDVGVSAVEVPDWRLARVASDHLPLLAELRMAEAGPAA